MNASYHRRLIVLAAFAAIATMAGAFGERANALDTKTACCTDGKCCGQKSCTGDCCKLGTCTASCAAKVVKSTCCSKVAVTKSACCTDGNAVVTKRVVVNAVRQAHVPLVVLQRLPV